MQCSNDGINHNLINREAKKTTAAVKKGFFNGCDVQGMSVAAGMVRQQSETLLTQLSARTVADLSTISLLLAGNSEHAQQFNEMVRRIEKPQQQQHIVEMLRVVTDVEVEKVVLCCEEPSLLLGNEHRFLLSANFPYALLRSFRDEKITVNEFSTLISLHGIYQENMAANPLFKMSGQRLFDQQGMPDEDAWLPIMQTLQASNEGLSPFELLPDEGRTPFRFDVVNIIQNMQARLKAVRPVEAMFWHYDIPASSQTTVADLIRDVSTWVLSRFDDQEMVPSLTMRQSLLDAAFKEEAHRINPVIGSSSVSDIRKGGVNRYRDFALPFPGLPLPKIADYLPAPTIVDFQHHDFYHLLRVALLANVDADLFIAIGDALQKQQDQYHHAITSLTRLCQQKLASYEAFSDRVEHLSALSREKIKNRIECDFYKISKLLSYLKRARKAVGQLKFYLYDLEVCVSSYRQDEIFGKDKKFDFYYTSILESLNRNPRGNGRVLLDGKHADLAGRVVLPVITGKQEDSLTLYLKHIARINAESNLIGIFGAKNNDPYWQRLQRSKRFMASMVSDI